MSLRAELQSEMSRAALAVYKETVGVDYAYYHEGGAAVTVTAYPEQRFFLTPQNQFGQFNQSSRTIVHVPRQTGFPPTGGISLGDQFINSTDSNDALRIVEINSDDLEIIFDCVCERIRPKSTEQQE